MLCHASFPFAGVTVELLIQTILGPMGLIRQENDIPSGVDYFVAIAKLLYGRKDNAAGLHIQELTQMLTALRMFRRLPEQQL